VENMSYNSNGLAPSNSYTGISQRFVLTLLLITAVLFIGGMVGSASAQTNVLHGTVSVSSADGPSDRLPGAAVNLTTESGKTSRSTVTNDQGEYEFTNLSVGTYKLQVSSSGFKQWSSSVVMRAGEATQENVQLEIEDVSGNVTEIGRASCRERV